MRRLHDKSGPSVLLLLVLGFLGAAETEAQSLRGVVLYTTVEGPVESATVELISISDSVVARTLSGPDGRFFITAPADGLYYVRVSHLTAIPWTDGPVNLSEGATPLVTFEVDPQPLLLDSINVAVEQRSRSLATTGFYQRSRSGFGTFIDEQRIERGSYLELSDLLRTVPGVRVLESGSSLKRRTVMTSYALRNLGSCFPRVYLDDVLIETGGRTPPLSDFDNLLPVHDVAGVEIYARPAEVPPRYGQGLCGVILIWTKR